MTYFEKLSFRGGGNLLIKLINFHSPYNHQKTLGFLMVSGGIEVN